MTNQEAVEIIKSLMNACTPDSKYYKVGEMAINALSNNETIKERSYLEGFHEANKLYYKAIEEIKTEIENYMKNEGFGSGWIEDIKEIIDNHIGEVRE